jgi:hypothetical protein
VRLNSRLWVLLIGSIGAAAALGAGSSSRVPPPLFAGARTFSLGGVTDPTSIASADLNGDGKLDLAVGQFRTKSVSILFGRSDGRIGGRRDLRIGGGPFAIADLNGDQKLDLALVNPDTDSVSIFLGRGDGSFGAKRDYRTGDGPALLAIGDLNADGNPDLATANGRARTVSVLTNNGDGSFERHGSDVHVARQLSNSLAIEDFGGDGAPDVAASIVGGIEIFRNNGNATLESGRVYDVGTPAVASLAVADVNADGRPDLATADTFGPDNLGQASVLINRGGGNFGAAKHYRTGYGDQAIALGDLNADGKPDLVTANTECCPGGKSGIVGKEDSISVLTNRGDGTFARWREVETGPFAKPHLGDSPDSVAIGNLNSDKKPDIVTANEGPSTVSVLLNATGSCVVPNVKAKPITTARRAILGDACRTGTIRRAYSRSVARGRVISTIPQPGSVLRRGAKVTLIVSRGRKR